MVRDEWWLLVLTLPTRNRAARMRVWRGLKAKGCAAVRDGVYVLPGDKEHEAVLAGWAAEVNAAGGTARVFKITARTTDEARELRRLFDRTSEYIAVTAQVGKARRRLRSGRVAEAAALIKRARRDFNMVAATDHFPGAARDQVADELLAFEVELEARISPGEPRATRAPIHLLERRDYQGKTWATRKQPWVDRLASAWLIQRFIDRKAKLLWLANPGKCPKHAVGFDFDGAQFTHSGARVTFEVLVTSFGLDDDPALTQAGQLVHYLDVGGIPVPEAAGVERALRGARRRSRTDDALFEKASELFDSLYEAYREDTEPAGTNRRL